jgi:hypothetical protein
LPGIDRSPIPTVYLYQQKVLPGRSIWALIIPKYHEYIFAFADKSIGGLQDELRSLARRCLKNKQKSNDNEKISIENYSDDSLAGHAINKKLESLLNQVKQKFMLVLVAENVQSVKESGVKFLEEEGPVMLLDQLRISNPEVLDWKQKSLRAVL